jgi:hypothetical protein
MRSQYQASYRQRQKQIARYTVEIPTSPGMLRNKYEEITIDNTNAIIKDTQRRLITGLERQSKQSLQH